MDLSLSCSLRMQLICTVCENAIPQRPTLLSKLLDGKNDPVTVLLVMVKGGCCPLCGEVIAHGEQTPDLYIRRYCQYLKESA